MSWFEVAPGSPFGTEELPYGIFSTPDSPRRVGVAMGDRVLDLAAWPMGPGWTPRWSDPASMP